MPDLNKVLLMGRVTHDLELNFTQNDLPILTFTLAINTYKKGKDAEVYYANITAFGNTAEIISNYVVKGDPLFVEGRLQRSTWEHDGLKHSKDSVILTSFQFIKSREEEL